MILVTLRQPQDKNQDKTAIPSLKMPEDFFCSEEANHEICLRLSQEEKNEGLKYTHHFLCELVESNKSNPCFWYTPISEMQPFMSCLLRAIEVKNSLERYCCKLKGKFIFADSDIFLLDFIRKNFSEEIQIKNPFFIFFKSKGKSFKNFILRYVNTFAWFWEHSSHLRKSKTLSKLPNHIDFLFFSRFEKKHENQIFQEKWIDPYLGELPEFIHKDASIALIGRCGADPKKLSGNLATFSSFPLWTIYQHLKLRNLFQIIWQAFRFRLCTKHVSNRALADLAYKENLTHCRAIADCLLVEKALENLLEKVSVGKIIFMQENNAWESAIVNATKKAKLKVPTLGYFHCPVIPSSFRYHMNPTLLQYKPLPDKILTLGTEMSKAMKKLGDWGDKLMDGYAFRSPLPVKPFLCRKETEVEKKNLLVLLGGNYDNVIFLKWLDQEPKGTLSQEWRYLVKGHPRLSAMDFLKKAEIPYGPNEKFECVPCDRSIEDVLTEVVCVVFKGTTAGIIGLAAGLPTIHVDHNGMLTDNVLFNAEGLCTSVNNFESFQTALAKVSQNFVADPKAESYAFSYYNQDDKVQKKILEFLKN
ncbi:MAG: hypothetical protein GW748_07285 [Alphaproteobacteria bacterium]|nr:hypothetical protein [Candidatus Parcubacteria bacterium]NCQ67533.1 hypothetical protein [Alphaproteobacteria bacterium]